MIGKAASKRRNRGYRPDSLTGATVLERRDVPAASLQSGFTESIVAGGLVAPTAMEFAPDGRIFVAQQGGDVKIVKDGQLAPGSFVHLDVFDVGERGLLGLTLDPNFSQNHYVYMYYTTNSAPIHNRVIRFTADGNHAVPGSQKILLELPAIHVKRFFHHVGGAMHFGADGKLYVTTGDLGKPSNSQTLTNTSGKILRINPDGSIPSDNPFYRRAKGLNRAIWASGLRNPFTFAVQPGSGQIFINDVGLATWEEINQGRPGANYGWPITEGPTRRRGITEPIYAYRHGSAPEQGYAITGGVFYDPAHQSFPGAYRGGYFFADYINKWIHFRDAKTGAIGGFAANLSAQPIDLDVDPQGNLYFLGRSGTPGVTDAIYKIQFAPNAPPLVAQPPADVIASVGQAATFSASVSGSSPFTFQWQKNDVDIPGARGPDFTLGAVLADDRARFRVIVANQFGILASPEATLHVTTALPPSAQIVAPAENAKFRVGQTIAFFGVGTDPKDGDLPASAFTYQVDLDNNGHLHPILLPSTGSKTGSFVLPSSADLVGDVVFRIHLTVRDSAGLATTVTRTIIPLA